MTSAVAPAAAHQQQTVRREELHSLRTALERLRHGRGGVVEISGDPGSGKTRLLAETKRAAERLGLAALSGCCTEAEQRTTLAAFAPIVGSRLMAEALRDSAALPSSPFPPAATGAPHPSDPPTATACDPFVTLMRARQLLAHCARDGLVLLLDDFHWADECSVRIAEHFIRSPLDAPLLLVLAHRPRQSPPRLRAALAHGAEMGTVEDLTLGPLTLHQSADILHLPPDHHRTKRLHRLSDGNPFYLLALADRPPTVIGETASLTPREMRVMSAGAVLGREFDWTALATVADLPLDETTRAIDRLIDRDLFQSSPNGAGLTLRHPALGPLLRDHITPSWRAAAHRRALEFLSRHGAPPAELADHIEFLLETVGLGDVDLLENAARNALWTTPDLSARWAKAALRLLQEVAETDRRHLRLARILGHALALSGQLAESNRLLRRLRPVMRTASTPVRLRTAALHALVESLLDHHAEAGEVVAEALTGLPARPPAEAAGLYVVHGLVSLLAGRPPDPELVRAATRDGAQHHDRLARAGTLALRGLAEALAGQVEPAGRSLASAAALLDGLSDQRLRHHPEHLALLGRAELLIGRFAAARRHFDRGVFLLRSPGHLHLLPVLLTGLAGTCLRTGPLARAREAIDEAQEHSLQISAAGLYGTTMVLRAIERGLAEPDRGRSALRIAEQAFAGTPPNSDRWGVESAFALARAARLDGDPERCVRTLLDNLGGPDLPRLPAVLHPMCLELLACATAEAGRDATGWAMAAVRAAEALPGPSWAPYAVAARAHAARGAGEPDRAAELYQEAAAGFDRAELTGDEARMLALGAACLTAAGRPDRAEALNAAAARSAQRFGAKPVVEAVEPPARAARRCPAADRAAAAEPTAPERVSAAPLSLATLTKREREVAGLASTAIRTRDIAKALGLSPKTVDIHLTRIYRKLEIKSRVELVRRLGGLE
ncbi:helix-turn-helix transcriptional regulator [Kitasatospora aureofaciens]|uniref:helix-turn-helix transcriptional regulator n=1 Tax=Kitasatospora aureofaciens TaxID=1894 RepID=UPI0037C6076C